jgi:AraC family transcriptional regulator
LQTYYGLFRKVKGMILKTFPNLQWLKNQAENRFSNRKAYDGSTLNQSGWPSVVMNVKAGETFRDNIPGPLSFFSSVSGVSHVTVDGRKTIIPEEFFFVSNAGQRYTLEIEKKTPTETFNIHFGEKWAEDSLRALTEKTEVLLDQPEDSANSNIQFYNKLFVKDEITKSIQRQLLLLQPGDAIKEQELLFQLMSHLLCDHIQTRQRSLTIPAIKSATRDEILRRLFLATDYIYAYYHTELDLDQLSSVSCLSKFHFLRLFKIFFHQTPHQFITGLRIKKATSLLKQGGLQVKEISKSVGFDNANSFSRLFYQRNGVYPSQYLGS